MQGVATGAILSDDQRIRFESVCSRLHLRTCGSATSRTCSKRWWTLESELEAILIEVAAMGLEPKKHLAKTLGMMQAHLLMLQDLYGVHCCGEGGEFESSTSSPAVGQYCNLTFCFFIFHVQLLYQDTRIPRTVKIYHEHTQHD